MEEDSMQTGVQDACSVETVYSLCCYYLDDWFSLPYFSISLFFIGTMPAVCSTMIWKLRD